MSPQQDADGKHRQRPRASTNSFRTLWPRANKAEPSLSTAQAASTPTLSLKLLIEALTPPAVPSLSHARALVNALSSQTTLPTPVEVTLVLASLCSVESPVVLQAAGYDILAAYCEAGGATLLTLADRLTYLSLFTASVSIWAPELWEPRMKALQVLTHSAAEAAGMEARIVQLVREWTGAAFSGLLSLETVNEKDERERSIETLAAYLTSLVENVDILSRLSCEEVESLLDFYANLVDRTLVLPADFGQHTMPPSPPREAGGSHSSTPSRSQSHRRQASSTSSLSPISPSPKAPTRHPFSIAADLYLTTLRSLLHPHSPSYLSSALPVLFRILAFSASPLPHISLPSVNQLQRLIPSHLETQTNKMIAELLVGAYAASCTIILKKCLSPAPDMTSDLLKSAQTAVGAHRTLRTHIRSTLHARLTSNNDGGNWEVSKLHGVLCQAAKAWVRWDPVLYPPGVREAKDRILEESSGILKDVMQACDEMPDDEIFDDEDATAVSEILRELVEFIRMLQNPDGTPYILPLSHPTSAPTPLLRTLASLLARNESRFPLNPPIPIILLSIAEHLTDADSSKIPPALVNQHQLSPIFPGWLDNWKIIFSKQEMYCRERPLTSRALVLAIQTIHASVEDMHTYRRPFIDLFSEFWKRQVGSENEGEDARTMWGFLVDEVVLRATEGQEQEHLVDTSTITSILDLMLSVAASGGDRLDDVIHGPTTDPCTHSPITNVPVSSPTPHSGSPILSRMSSDFHSLRERETMQTSVMSILSSLTSPTASRGQSQHPQPLEDPMSPPLQPSTPDVSQTPRSVPAVAGLIGIFCQLTFTPFSLSQAHLQLAVRIWMMLLKLLSEASCPFARLTILRFAMRLRADRDHRIYFVDASLDPDDHIASLASSIHRMRDRFGSIAGQPESSRTRTEEGIGEDIRLTRPRIPQMQQPDRDGRRASRGRGNHHSQPTPSRSRSRAPASAFQLPTPTGHVKPRDTLWLFPDVLPFTVPNAEQSSEGLITYDPDGPGNRVVLPLSAYVLTLVEIIKTEKNWEILSYVLCHLPVQLANKHFFCGPNTQKAIVTLLTTLCFGILEGDLASTVDWPVTLRPRDAHGLAYHTLSVLISYRKSFDMNLRHVLVEALQAGLSGDQRTIKCCLDALSLAAFELQPSMTRYLSRILEKLSQITTNPDMVVHIINFLAIVASLNSLYANFTEADFKMVFGVALQYLQHHNRPDSLGDSSWALSQHVLIMSYYIVYIWFLAIKLPDRRKHVPFITRQLLLANEGRNEVDESTEVCFDWIARYTYASADPRPATSLLGEIVMNPRTGGQGQSNEVAISEKTWVIGNSVVTVRTLAKLGWMEMVSRRPSGMTKFLCKVENVPMVGPGDVDPDMISVPAALMMDRDPVRMHESILPGSAMESTSAVVQDDVHAIIASDRQGEHDSPERPDEIKGYVWSGSAPSQRRKDVSIDPSFIALQLSSYPSPGILSLRGALVADESALKGFFRNLDRIPVIDTHKVGIMYVAPGQSDEREILRNTHGSPAYTRFLEGIGRLIKIRGQQDVYVGGLDPEEDGEYAYAWWDDIGQILYHTATLMPTHAHDENCTNKKRHIGNDHVRIVWNDSGVPYRFDTLSTQFQFVNIVIEPHSHGTIAAFSDDDHENEFFKITVQRAPGMIEFTPVGHFKLISANSLPLLVRQLSLLSDWFASIFEDTQNDSVRVEKTTHWRSRLQAIKRFRANLPVERSAAEPMAMEGVMGQEMYRDFTRYY